MNDYASTHCRPLTDWNVRYLNMTTKHKEWWWLQNFVDSGEPSFQGVHTALFQVASYEPLVPKSWDSLSRSPNPSAAHTGEHVHVKCRQDELCQVLSKHEDMMRCPSLIQLLELNWDNRTDQLHLVGIRSYQSMSLWCLWCIPDVYLSISWLSREQLMIGF